MNRILSYSWGNAVHLLMPNLMTGARAIAVRRLLAFAIDWLVVMLWAGVLFGAVMLATAGAPPRPDGPWVAQGIGFLTMTLPVLLYFAVCESSSLQASLGKRLLGLVVRRDDGRRLAFRTALLRNAIKFVPWEFGHTVAQQAAYSDAGGFASWVWAPAAVAFLGPAWWLAAMLVHGQPPYDRWTSARVVRVAAAGELPAPQ